MNRFFFIFHISLFFVCFKCFSQSSDVWDYRERIFVERKQDVYVLELFHHKVEMITDTLLFVSNSVYAGKKYTLFIESGRVYIKSNNGHKRLELEITKNEGLRILKNRKEYYSQFSNERAN